MNGVCDLFTIGRVFFLFFFVNSYFHSRLLVRRHCFWEELKSRYTYIQQCDCSLITFANDSIEWNQLLWAICSLFGFWIVCIIDFCRPSKRQKFNSIFDSEIFALILNWSSLISGYLWFKSPSISNQIQYFTLVQNLNGKISLMRWLIS